MSRLRRTVLAWLVVVCVTAGLVGAGLWASAAVSAASAHALGKTKTYPAHLLVYAQEWSLWPSRTRLPAGTIDVQLWNRGQDAHDLRIRRVNAQGAMVGRVLGGVPVTPSGAVHSAVWHLKAGTYEIYCSLPGHLMMGMHARISVVG